MTLLLNQMERINRPPEKNILKKCNICKKSVLVDELLGEQVYLANNETEIEKREKNQKIVRNELKTIGKYGIPLIKKQNIDLGKIEPWCFVKTKLNDEEYKHKTIHNRVL